MYLKMNYYIRYAIFVYPIPAAYPGIDKVHAPTTLPPHTMPPVPKALEAGWAPDAIWKLLRGDKSVAYVENRTITFQLFGP
jgi:hypothetical protein